MNTEKWKFHLVIRCQVSGVRRKQASGVSAAAGLKSGQSNRKRQYKNHQNKDHVPEVTFHD